MKLEPTEDEEFLSTHPVSRKQNIDLAEITGGEGLWQRRIFLIICFLHIPCAFHTYSMSFLAPNIDHWCARPPEATNFSVEQWRNLAIPSNDPHCSRYEYVNLTYSLQNKTDNNEQATIPCETWEYDTTLYRSTLLSKFDLVCDRKWLVSLSKSVYIAGMSLSLIVFGHLSDWIGRKPVMLISSFITVLPSVMSAFSTTFATFLIARFFIALGVTVFFNTPLVLLMEIVAPRYHNFYGMGVQLGWSLGMIMLPLLAWLIRDSFWIQVAISSPCLMLLAIQWIPESPRWMLNHGKTEEAKEILLAAAKINGVKHSEEDKNALRDLMTNGNEAYKSGGSKSTILDLLKTPGLRQITLNIFFNWFVISFVYYGLSINTNELAGDPFVNFALAGVVEIPAYLLTILVAESLGKKELLIASMAISGIACFISYLVPSDLWWLTVTISSIGKFSITAAFGIIYILSNELFPTVVRNAGMGSASVCARLGSIIAPFMRELGNASHPIFPHIIFGILATASGISVILLPNTKNRSIPDTMEEAVQFSRRKNSMLSKGIERCYIAVKLRKGEANNKHDNTDSFITETTFPA